MPKATKKMIRRKPKTIHPKDRAKRAAGDVTAEFEAALRKGPKSEFYVLRLYITGTSPRSMTAIANIRKFCDEHLKGRVDLEVIDIYQQPKLAQGEQIIAAPTLVKELPFPLRKVVGDLSNEKSVFVGLDIRPKNN